MARLCVNGLELGRLKTLKYDKAFFVNGRILINRGNGWKFFGKVKKGHSITDIYNRLVDSQKQWFITRPSFKKFYDEIMKKSILNRYYLLTCIEKNLQYEDYRYEVKYARFEPVDAKTYELLTRLYSGVLTEQKILKTPSSLDNDNR